MAKDYRADIDGLRAFAVLPVVIYHAGFQFGERLLLPGGFLGVDVFFVISGYLITRILLGEHEAGGISITRFYERRARRILPALFAMIAVCLPFAWWLMSPEQLENFAQSAIWTTLFVSNVFFWLDTGYFSEAVHYKPLVHTWSLAVEEQFYLFFPLLLALVLMLRLRLDWLIIAGVITSLVAAEYLSQTRPAAGFYLLPARAWELGAGALLAVMEVKRGRPQSSGFSNLALAVSIMLIGGSYLMATGTMVHPGLATVPVVAGSMGIIWFGHQNGHVSRALSWRPLVFIGLVSYSLYLWHQPVFAFAYLYSINELTQWERVVLALIAVALAIVSWAIVERPFRRRVSARAIWAVSATGSSLAIAVGVWGVASGGWPERMPDAFRQLAYVDVGYANLEGSDCLRSNCVVGNRAAEPTVALVGDSHAAMLSHSLDRALSASDRSALVVADSTVFADRYPEFVGSERNERLEEQQARILSDGVDLVILAARYTEALTKRPFDNGEGGVEALWPNPEPFRSESQQDELAEAVAGGVRLLLASGKRTVLVYPVPEVGWHVPNTLAKLLVRGASPSDLTTSWGRYRERNATIISAFDALGEHENLVRVRPDDFLCDGVRCLTFMDGSALYHDDDHLSVFGSDMLVAKIIEAATLKWAPL